MAKGDTKYKLDDVGNLNSIDYAVSTDVKFKYDALNRTTNMVDASGTTKYTWTAGNQLLTEDGPFSSDTLTNTYSSRLRTRLDLQQPTGVWTNTFGYDAAKRLTNVTSPAGSFDYLYVGQASSLPKKIALPNTAYITNTYDTVARLLSTTLKNNSGTALDAATYGYNTGNQRVAVTNAANATISYTYDNIGQLKNANSVTNSEDRGYFYDTAWNLTYRTNNGTSEPFPVDGKNQLTNAPNTGFPAGTLGYDNNGNMTQSDDGAFRYEYDDENQLTALELIEDTRLQFTYDGKGRLKFYWEFYWDGSDWVESGEWNYIYDGHRVLQEQKATTPQVSYTRGIDLSGSLEGAGGIGGMLARSHGYSGGNFTNHNFYHADGNGNITYMVNTNQSMVASYRYDPFGNNIYRSGSLCYENSHRFSSKPVFFDYLYYYGYRWYAPNLQRWLNRDPIQEWGGYNLYRFVHNAPTIVVDLFGFQAQWPVPIAPSPIIPVGPMGPAWDPNYHPGHFEFPEGREHDPSWDLPVSTGPSHPFCDCPSGCLWSSDPPPIPPTPPGPVDPCFSCHPLDGHNIPPYNAPPEPPACSTCRINMPPRVL